MKRKAGTRGRSALKPLGIAILSAVVLAGGTARADHQSPSTRGCPDARTCGLYSLDPWRWPAKKSAITIEYYVNPAQPWISEQQAVGAVLTAARTWMDANSRIRLVFKGITSKSPFGPFDGANVIGWVPMSPDSPSVAFVSAPGGRRISEADITLNVLYPWAWSPCGRRHGSCTNVPDGGSIRYWDVQAAVTHEFGHWFSLRDLQGDAGRQLTMYGEISAGERRQSTLGLGDIRGARAAYPCSCRSPRIWVP